MIKLSLLLPFILLLSILSAPAFAERTSFQIHNPCPKNEIVCMVKMLEGYIPQLKYNSDFHEKFFAPHMGAIAMGYAKLSNIEKAEEFRKKSLEIWKKYNSLLYINSRILEQYIHLDQHDLVLNILTEDSSDGACTSVAQLYTYNGDYKNLQRVLSQTNCKLGSINSICHHTSEKEFVTRYKKISSFSDEDTRKSLYNDAQKCMAIYTRQRIRNGESPSYSDLEKSFGISLPTNISQRVKTRLVDIYIRHERFDAAAKQITKLQNFYDAVEAYSDLVSALAYKNDIRALQYNQDMRDYIWGKLWLLSFIRGDYYPDHKKLYSSLGNNSTGLETKFLVIRQIQNSKHRLAKLYDILLKSSNIGTVEITHDVTKEVCSNNDFSKCVFNEIEKAYKQYLWSIDIDISKYSNRLIGSHEMYMNANTIIGNFDVAKRIGKKHSLKLNEKIINGHSTSCYKLFNGLENTPINCLYTSGLYLDALPRHKNRALNKWQLSIVKRIPQRAISFHANALQDLKVASLDIPNDLRDEILKRSMGVATSVHKGISKERANKIMKALFEYYMEDGNYSFYPLKAIYTYYKDLENKIIPEQLETHSSFAQDLKSPPDPYGITKTVIRDDIKSISNNMQYKLFQKVMKGQGFVPVHPMKITQ